MYLLSGTHLVVYVRGETVSILSRMVGFQQCLRTDEEILEEALYRKFSNVVFQTVVIFYKAYR